MEEAAEAELAIISEEYPEVAERLRSGSRLSVPGIAARGALLALPLAALTVLAYASQQKNQQERARRFAVALQPLLSFPAEGARANSWNHLLAEARVLHGKTYANSLLQHLRPTAECSSADGNPEASEAESSPTKSLNAISYSQVPTEPPTPEPSQLLQRCLDGTESYEQYKAEMKFWKYKAQERNTDLQQVKYELQAKVADLQDKAHQEKVQREHARLVKASAWDAYFLYITTNSLLLCWEVFRRSPNRMLRLAGAACKEHIVPKMPSGLTSGILQRTLCSATSLIAMLGCIGLALAVSYLISRPSGTSTTPVTSLLLLWLASEYAGFQVLRILGADAQRWRVAFAGSTISYSLLCSGSFVQSFKQGNNVSLRLVALSIALTVFTHFAAFWRLYLSETLQQALGL
jgi:hypothetical protein